MATLHIEHPITDFDTWTSAFNRFADVRREAGVRAQRVQRPVDDPMYVVIDLDFDTTDDAKDVPTLPEYEGLGDPRERPRPCRYPRDHDSGSRCGLLTTCSSRVTDIAMPHCHVSTVAGGFSPPGQPGFAWHICGSER